MNTPRVTALVALIFASLYAHAEQGRLVDVSHLATRNLDEIREMADPMFDVYGVPELQHEVDLYRISFESSDFDGSIAEVGANLFIPRAGAGDPLPLLVFGSGTTGVADHCAPSREEPLVRRWGHYEANMLAYASNGIVTVFPDYLGFNDPDRPQRYFSRDAEGHVMLDAVRAARQFFEEQDSAVSLSEYVFLAGYSQGGHAAFSAADLRLIYAPDVQIHGVISYGGTMNVEALLREGPYYAPYIFYTYHRMYGSQGVKPTEYLLDVWTDTMTEDVERMCVDEFQVFYPFDGAQLYRPDFHRALMARELDEEFPDLQYALDANLAGLSGHGVPSLIVQGEHDVIVTPAAQQEYVKRLCENGSPTRYLVLESVRHRFTRAAGFRATLPWMEEIMAGGVPTDCDSE